MQTAIKLCYVEADNECILSILLRFAYAVTCAAVVVVFICYTVYVCVPVTRITIWDQIASDISFN